MNFIKKELEPNTIVIGFNPWLFNDQEQLIKVFFSIIATELDASISTGKEKVGKVLSDYGDAVGTVPKYFGVSLDGLKTVGDKLQNVSIEKLKSRVDDIISASGKKLVICIDDIDRLDVNEIQHIFKLVKLVGEFPNTTYVLAFDDEMVATALAPNYGEGNKDNGYQFLEKIVQLPLKIPKATRRALKDYMINMLSKVIDDLQISLSQKEINKFREVFDEHFVPYLTNPRVAIRYANAVHFALPMLLGEANIPDLLFVEALKIIFPAAYEFTRHNAALLMTDTTRDPMGNSSRYKEKEDMVKEVNQFLNTLQKEQQDAVKSIWQAMFPQYRYAVSNRGYSDEAWRKWYVEKRICSGRYFERYFTYAVQSHEISDVQFQLFLSEIAASDLTTGEKRFNEFFITNDPADIIFKLQILINDIPASQAKNLSIVLAKRDMNYLLKKESSVPTRPVPAPRRLRRGSSANYHQRKGLPMLNRSAARIIHLTIH